MSWTRKRIVTGPDGRTYTETTHAEGQAVQIAPGVRVVATGKTKTKGKKKDKKKNDG